MPYLTSRRTFLAAATAASAACAWAKSGTIRVGCQANGFPLKPGDFPGLLQALESMKSLGYTGFECNYKLVEGEFGRAAGARAQIEKTGVTFIGAHAAMDIVDGAQGARIAAGAASLGAACIIMSGKGLSAVGQFEKEALLQKAKELDKIATSLKGSGLRLAYHNHNPDVRQPQRGDERTCREYRSLSSQLPDGCRTRLPGRW